MAIMWTHIYGKVQCCMMTSLHMVWKWHLTCVRLFSSWPYHLFLPLLHCTWHQGTSFTQILWIRGKRRSFPLVSGKLQKIIWNYFHCCQMRTGHSVPSASAHCLLYFQGKTCCISPHREQRGLRITAEALVNYRFHFTFPGSLVQLTASTC